MLLPRLILLAKNQTSIRQEIDIHVGGIGIVIDGLPEDLDIFGS